MTMGGEYTATIDRIVDGETAVLLLEEDGDVVEQFDVPVAQLPDDTGEGAVVRVTLRDDEVVSIEPSPDATAAREERIREKFERLSRRLDDE